MNHLILLFTVILCMTSCNPEETPPEELSWAGDWVASIVLKDDLLVEIPDTFNGFSPRFIKVKIEEGNTGFLLGASFIQEFGMEFRLSPKNQVEFGPVEGTRAQEEEWGGAVISNISKTSSYEVELDSLYFKDLDANTLIIFTKPQ